MFCKFCGNKVDDKATFCSNCGKKLEEEKNVIARERNVDEEHVTLDDCIDGVQVEKKFKIPEKALFIINKICFWSSIAGLVGIALFLGIVFVGLIAYGKVYLFDGYAFTAVLSVFSIVFMFAGLIAFIAKILLWFVFKTENFPTSLIKRILVISMAVLCLAFSIWGMVDCGVSNNDSNYDNSSDGSSDNSSTYVSFYTIYNECGCAYPWASVESSYIRIDTNPYDYDSDSSNATKYSYVAQSAIKAIHSRLSVPSYVYQEMLSTRAIDGKQTYSGTKVNISWRYHPDQGLEVTYTR